MQNNIFYTRVSSWIRSYRNPDMLDWVRDFVGNSTEPTEVKEQLFAQINEKERKLRQKPQFKEIEGISYLANDEYEVIEWETRFGAVCKLSELMLKGYDVHLNQVGVNKYRIMLYEDKNKTIADHYAGMVANA